MTCATSRIYLGLDESLPASVRLESTLEHVADSGSVVTGLVVLCVGPREPVVSLAGILPALSQALCRAGDVVPYAGAS